MCVCVCVCLYHCMSVCLINDADNSFPTILKYIYSCKTTKTNGLRDSMAGCEDADIEIKPESVLASRHV